MKRSYTLPALAVCRQALLQGHLIKAGSRWLCGRRLFSPRTVNALLETGEAIRIDDRVVSLSLLMGALNADPA